ncbi:MAG: TetR/AcrR family transcriptional regulator [Halioglobus sp.]
MTAAEEAPAASASRADETRSKLLFTALRLYAEEGLHAVSLRRISNEAGSRNSAAMHYHFENRLGVIKALVELIARELAVIARELKSEKSDERNIRTACREILKPLVRLPSQNVWGPDAVRFLSRMVSESDEEIATLVNEFYSPFFKKLDKALARELPHLPAQVRKLRLMFISTNVLHGVADAAWLKHSPLGDLSQFAEDTLLEHLVDYLIGGLCAPSH